MNRLIFHASVLALFVAPAHAVDTRSVLEPLLSEHCYDCHDDLTSEGDLNLFDLDFDPSDPENFDRWAKVFERIEGGEMPPKEKKRPEDKAVEDFLAALEPALMDSAKLVKSSKGRVQSRRLTRVEYENTLHDLLGIDLPLSSFLPADPAPHGFETVATEQQISHFNLGSYLEVADMALTDAFDRAGKKETVFQKKVPVAEIGKRFPGNYRGPQIVGEEAILWPQNLQFYGRLPATQVPVDGWYEITLKGVRAINPKNPAIWATLRSGRCASNEPMLFSIGLVEATTETQDMVYRGYIQAGHMLEFRVNEAGLKQVPGISRGGSIYYQDKNLVKEGFEGIAVRSIEMERIFPNGSRLEVRNHLLGDLKQEERAQLLDPKADNANLIARATQQFMSKAFRRPVDSEAAKPYVDLALSHLADHPKDNAINALRVAYRAVLCSPRFLTFVEKPGKLDPHALAARMSFMLWASMPDKELRKLADSGELANYKTRHAQVNRMLNDPKADRFIESFTDQWLKLKEIDFTSPDRRRFRTFDPIVQDSMLAETRAFVKELLVKNKSVTHLVDSDFTLLNERLVRFYGLKDLKVEPGEGLQRVSLKDYDVRGGLVTHGSVLKVTADGTSTSPIVRGVYMGERIIGIEIPPPPPGVPAVEPDIRGAVSIRDQLAKHSSDQSCAACHELIDPAGFALESFDPVGLFRTKYGTQKNAAVVDPSGVTPEGTAFEGVRQWKSAYVDRPEQLAESFATQLLTYGTGAYVNFGDRPSLKKIVQQSAENDYGMKSILHAVVASEAFLQK